MKTIQKPTNSASTLQQLLKRHSNSTWTAIQIEQKPDTAKIANEINAFIGNDLKAVTVLLLKG